MDTHSGMKFSGRWYPETNKYKEACLRLAKDMTNFKQDPDYVYYVGNDNRAWPVVEAFDKVVEGDYIKENDIVGNPRLHNGKSAGTLRFMKVVEDVDRYTHLNIDNIVEVGGGYGGQSLIFNSTWRTYWADYTIIDIPEALELSKAYLKDNNVPCTFISSENVPKLETDLLLSDYCLSELNEKGIDFYLERIKAKYCYITCNSQGELRDYLLNALSKYFTVTFEPENPKTSKYENIIIYGTRNN